MSHSRALVLSLVLPALTWGCGPALVTAAKGTGSSSRPSTSSNSNPTGATTPLAPNGSLNLGNLPVNNNPPPSQPAGTGTGTVPSGGNVASNPNPTPAPGGAPSSPPPPVSQNFPPPVTGP